MPRVHPSGTFRYRHPGSLKNPLNTALDFESLESGFEWSERDVNSRRRRHLTGKTNGVKGRNRSKQSGTLNGC